jgi:hypothetical protein
MITGHPVAGAGSADLGDAGAPVAASAVPQSLQKRNDGGLPWPQVGHARASSVPQLPQYLAPTGFSNSHLKQATFFAVYWYPIAHKRARSVSMSCRTIAVASVDRSHAIL